MQRPIFCVLLEVQMGETCMKRQRTAEHRIRP